MSSTEEILQDFPVDPDILEQIEKANRQLIDLARSKTNPTVDVKHIVLVGNPAELILETVREYHIDLVVIGATRANWLDRLLVGSTTERVIQNAACPVITLKCSIENVAGLRHIVFAFNPDEDQSWVVAELKKLQTGKLRYSRILRGGRRGLVRLRWRN